MGGPYPATTSAGVPVSIGVPWWGQGNAGLPLYAVDRGYFNDSLTRQKICTELTREGGISLDAGRIANPEGFTVGTWSSTSGHSRARWTGSAWAIEGAGTGEHIGGLDCVVR